MCWAPLFPLPVNMSQAKHLKLILQQSAVLF